MNRGMIAIVGRPNVGKSTLFNRLTRSNQAIIDDRPGVTRDRLYGISKSVYDEDDYYTVIDTGGFETKDLYYQPFSDNIVWQQTEYAIQESDAIVFVVDAKSGLHPHDQELFHRIKKLNKPVIFVANKVDGIEKQAGCLEFYELGVEDIHYCSAAHNRGVWELSEVIETCLQHQNAHRQDTKHSEEGLVKLAIIGRPNAGKSSILNRMCGENRSIVSDVAGTTRDPINTFVTYNQQRYEILDTAGIRRKSKIHDKVESISVIKSLKAIEDADMVLLVMAADEGLSDQDARLATLAAKQCKPLLIVVNKWDLITNKETNTARDYELEIKRKIQDISFIPVLFISCLENRRVSRILPKIEELREQASTRIATARINEVLEKAVREHTPALIRSTNKRVKFYYATQVTVMPPTIVVKCNVADQIQESYKRYLRKRFQRELGFSNVAIRMIFRAKTDEKSRASTRPTESVPAESGSGF